MSKDNNDNRNPFSKMDYHAKIAFSIGILIFAITILFPWFLSSVMCIEGTKKAGESGDLYGSLNTLFSGLAFTALIYTIFLQRNDLKAQEGAIEVQRKEQLKQRFEMFLFNSLNQIREQKENASMKDNSGEEVQGKGIFKLVAATILNELFTELTEAEKTRIKNRIYITPTNLILARDVLNSWYFSFLVLIREMRKCIDSKDEMEFWSNYIFNSLTLNEKTTFVWLCLLDRNECFDDDILFSINHRSLQTTAGHFTDTIACKKLRLNAIQYDPETNKYIIVSLPD